MPLHAHLAIIGHGNVGRRFGELLRERAQPLLDDYGLECRIVGTATRRGGARFGEQPCSDPFELIERLAGSGGDLRILIETTTLDVKNGEPAISHVRAGLSHGCHVVTANKGPVAFAYAELRALAREHRVQFRFEGSVMDGIPVFNLVRETMPVVRIHGFEGVVNTTTNHIITALESGQAFAAALAEMQARGIAEADPSLDVDGWDAAAKAAALANVLMDAGITPHDVARTGLVASTAEAARNARDRGLRLKLVAEASRGTDGRVSAGVRLREVPADHLLATLEGDANALILHTDLLGDVAITQLSSSLTQTAYALLSDTVGIVRQHA